jgi:hypothetical protein
LTAASYGADGVSYVQTGKSTTDHFASMVSKKDCALLRAFRNQQICREREGDHDPYQVNYDIAERQPSEDGVSYAPPLHAAADAPAASWTAEAYKPAAAPVAPDRAGPCRRRSDATAATGRGQAGAGAQAGQEEDQGRRQGGQEGFTASGGVSPLSRKASRLSSALKPIALRVSTVAEPMCGSRNAFSSP